MLNLIFIIIFISPICFISASFWMVQNLLFLIAFLFILINFCTNYFVNIYFLGFDTISYGLIWLSFWICTLIITASESFYKYNNYKNLFLFNILILLLFLVLKFASTNLFIFYLFFERILGWGYQPERLQAGVYLLFYTLLFSVPILVGIFYLYNNLMTLNFFLIRNYLFNYNLLYLSLILYF